MSAIASYDDGTGESLYVAGDFHQAGGINTCGIAKFDGDKYTSLGGVEGLLARVAAMVVYDDGTGPALFVAGTFDSVGGTAANNIARWDGLAWSPVGPGIDDVFPTASVEDLIVFDGDLYATGRFSEVGFVPVFGIARWNGNSWSGLAGGLFGGAGVALATHDDGGGRALYVAGSFKKAGPINVRSIAKWNGAHWSQLGHGLSTNNPFLPPVNDILSFDDGSGAKLYAVGGFSHAGGTPISRIAAWDGNEWHRVGGGLLGLPNKLARYHHDDRDKLLIGGALLLPNGTALSLAQWGGNTWTTFVAGFEDAVNAMAMVNLGDGDQLYVGTSHATDSLLRFNDCASGPIQYGVAGAGSGDIAPRIGFTGGLPSIGNASFALTVDNGLGGAGVRLLIGTHPLASITPFGALYTDRRYVYFQLLSGVPGGSGTGSASFPFPIPNVPDLIGVDFYAQALIPDLASTGEISHTQGLLIPITH